MQAVVCLLRTKRITTHLRNLQSNIMPLCSSRHLKTHHDLYGLELDLGWNRCHYTTVSFCNLLQVCVPKRTGKSSAEARVTVSGGWKSLGSSQAKLKPLYRTCYAASVINYPATLSYLQLQPGLQDTKPHPQATTIQAGSLLHQKQLPWCNTWSISAAEQH